ncbi:MAG: hypothetical protein K0U41_00455, partial [Gammaproteobacteria bacterium]|nr:hypothetical protein [Gammaproteobacteria bacterium]
DVFDELQPQTASLTFPVVSGVVRELTAGTDITSVLTVNGNMTLNSTAAATARTQVTTGLQQGVTASAQTDGTVDFLSSGALSWAIVSTGIAGTESQESITVGSATMQITAVEITGAYGTPFATWYELFGVEINATDNGFIANADQSVYVSSLTAPFADGQVAIRAF